MANPLAALTQAAPAQVPQTPPAGAAGILARLAPQLAAQQQPAPAPTHAQTVAAMHRFGSIKAALQPVLSDPNLGKSNIRPKLLDAASDLLGEKVLSLPEIMNAIKDLPDDPLQQKKFVEMMYGTATKAQIAVLNQHRNANLPQEDGDEWTPDSHDQHFAGLMAHYPGAR
ncbi:MAG TPA: hypothetical protein VFX37_10470 [Pseudolabrys sp.]|nr:hypothetical protein [Pseudolabrys sp.]